MSTKERMGRMSSVIDRVLERVGLTDVATIGTLTVRGYFNREYLRMGAGDEMHGGWIQTFDCEEADLPALAEGDEISIEDEGEFLYQRKEPNGAGRVLVHLGSKVGP